MDRNTVNESQPLLSRKYSRSPPPSYETDMQSKLAHSQLNITPTYKTGNELYGRLNGSGAFGVLFNFAKASVGSGSFGLPGALLSAGIVLGSVSMLIIGVVSLYTMLLILELKRKCFLRDRNREWNFSQIGRYSGGILGQLFVDASVVMCNLGVCAGYMLFIGGNLRYPLVCWIDYPTNEWLTFALLVPILILLTLIPSFKLLSYAAYVGWTFLAVAMGAVYYYGISNGQFNTQEVVTFNFPGFPIFYGVTAFLFCVHSMVIPLESEMAKPSQMKYVLVFAAAIVIIVNLPFAIFGYLLFGTNTKGQVFDNLGAGIFNNIVRLMLSIELTLTFPIVFKPASEIFENLLPRNLTKKPVLRIMIIIILRFVLVMASFGFAAGVPYFQFMLALVGGFATTLLAFIYPPIFHFLLFRRETHIVKNVFHLVLVFLGVVSIISTTTTTIIGIVHKYESTNGTDNGNIECFASNNQSINSTGNGSAQFYF